MSHRNLPETRKPLHVVFIHLDLGIGGAEQLVLQLATASQKAQHQVDLVTTRCDPTHCFATVAPGGALHPHVHVWGQWIPHDIMGLGRAACSTLRLLYLAYRVARKQSPDLIVLDVLSTPLPLLRLTDAALLFYCHFPDRLLTRSKKDSMLKRFYRSCMDWLEEVTMSLSDLCVVNSKFTQKVVSETFPSLDAMPVLYPALDTASLSYTSGVKKEYRIVSLNRYERKKNLGLVIEAAAWLQKNSKTPLPDIVIAGGYDVKNVENVEYRGELGRLAQEYKIPVNFMLSISDEQRRKLLQTSLCVIYTPENEHFGIVPVEAMYCATPVVAVNSGGPMETIRDGVTGFLCEPNGASMGKALEKLLPSPQLAARMGQEGRKHVQETFGEERLVKEWIQLTSLAVERGRQRLAQPYRLTRSFLYFWEALITLVVSLLLTWILRQLDVLEPSESLWSGIRKLVKHRDEL